MQDTIEERKEKISDLYRNILEREPDSPGLASYLHSDLTIEQIEFIMQNSTERLGLNSKKNFKSDVNSVGNAELFVMGSSPKTDEHSNALMGSGVKAMLDLNVGEPSYDRSWCVDFLHVPIDPEKPLTKDIIDKCFTFIHKNVIDEGNRIFLHSRLGVSRSPLIMILFLVAEKGLSFYNALRLVHSKQPTVNPSRELLTADILDYVYSYRKKFGAVERDRAFVSLPSVPSPENTPRQPPVNKDEKPLYRVNSRLFAGTFMDNEVLAELSRINVKTVLDINLNAKSKNFADSGFNVVHLPLFTDQLETLMPLLMKSIDRYTKDVGIYLYSEDNTLLRTILNLYIKANPGILDKAPQQNKPTQAVRL